MSDNTGDSTMTEHFTTNTGLRRAHGGFLDIRLGTLLKRAMQLGLVVAVVAFLGFAAFVLYPAHTIPALEPVDEYVYLDQGWGTQRDTIPRQTYYYTGQGTSLPQGDALHPLRYSWFVNLEMPFGKERFADPDHMRAYRFLVDPAPTEANPDQLPVGFARHFSTVVNEYVLDITCAACHTGQLHVEKDGKRVAVRVDGGQAMHAFADMSRGNFGPTLVASMLATYVNPVKFRRFARNVLGDGYDEGKANLRRELGATIRAFASIGQDNPLRHLYPTQEGFGRTDALSRIANTVFGDHLVPGNYHTGSAPVSYPYVWNIWKFDWVQYNGSVSQPLARNIGESLGVGAVINLVDANRQPIPAEQRYVSSVRVPDLVTIEHTLQRLTPPRWPEDLLGAVDHTLAATGKALFEQHCQGCHGPHVADPLLQASQAPGKRQPGTQWTIEVIPVEHVGTDPTAAVGFVERRYDLSATGISDADVRGVLRPILVRKLVRDVRYRLQSVVEQLSDSETFGTELGGERLVALADELDGLLESYPSDAPQVSVDATAFASIGRAVEALAGPMPQLSLRTQPDTGYSCDLECHSEWLAWNVRYGEASIDSTLDGVDVNSVTEGEGLNILGLLIKNKYYQDHNVSFEQQQCLEGFGTLDLPQQIAGYKPRPLEGVWATPPFLHNGSVPTLHQMLIPPEQRDKRFFVGRRDYDTTNLGYVTEPADGGDGFWLDTSITGNHNTGHAFAADPEAWQRHRQDPKANPLAPGVIGPLLEPGERTALLEYLKIHRDEPGTPTDFSPPDCRI
ncbi:MAG: di-heme-cytochrome C peroxidase [Pseudomonadota bacterium]